MAQEDTPIAALRPGTRKKITDGLFKKKVLASEENLPRDWRGLAQLAGVAGDTLEQPGVNPTDQLLTIWGKGPQATFGKLKEFLGRIDRWDILDDIDSLMEKDAELYRERLRTQTANQRTIRSDKVVLFFEDISRAVAGLELEVYDALLLYADKDLPYAREMIDKLEMDYNLKVCLNESIIPGLQFEHQILLQIISKRCRHVIIIISRNFIHSPVNMFSVSFAQSLAIENRRRIIIPCMYDESTDLELPDDIKMLYKLDYNKTTLRDYNFWDRLRTSVVQLPQFRQSPMIRELNTLEYQQLRIKPPVPDVVGKMPVPDIVALPPCHTAPQETFKYKIDQVDVKEKERVFSTTTLHGSYTVSCSTPSAPETVQTMRKSKSTSFIKKLFKSKKTKPKREICL